MTILHAAIHETEQENYDFCHSRSDYTDTDPITREKGVHSGNRTQDLLTRRQALYGIAKERKSERKRDRQTETEGGGGEAGRCRERDIEREPSAVTNYQKTNIAFSIALRDFYHKNLEKNRMPPFFQTLIVCTQDQPRHRMVMDGGVKTSP